MHGFVPRRGRTLWAVGLLSAAWALGGLPMLAAAETNQATEDESTIEIPAPVYLTLMLARDRVVHAELGLDRRQIEAVQAAVAEVDHPLWLLRDVPVPKCADKLEALRLQLRKGLDTALSAEQVARFDQLLMQARGAKALVAPDVVERLQLSDKQRERLKQIVAEAKGGTLDSKKVVAVLSAEQQAALATMFGRQFDLSRVSHIGCIAPEFRGVDGWINSAPLSLAELRGKVVVVHFWAFNCINCIHNLPHYQSWFDKYPQSDLVIVGIHTPETGTERNVDNLRANIKERGIKYPVAVDGAAENWKAWANNMWPSVYVIDRHGQVRAWWYGELNWEGARGEESIRKRIEQLLVEK